MNICFFSAMSALGGGELWILRATTILRNRGHQVSIVCSYRSALFFECVKQELDVYAYQQSGGVPFYEPLYQFLKRRHIDVLHCTVIGAFCESKTLERVLDRINRGRSTLPAILILKTGLPPQTGLSSEYYGFGGRSCVRRLHVVSQDIKDAFVAWQPQNEGKIEEYVQVVREGVDVERFASVSREKARDQWEVKEGQVVITSIARLHPQKGQDNLLLAAKDVVKTHPEVLFILAGDGEDRSRLEQLRDHLQLQQHVRFGGHIEDVPSLLAATDIFCHPSLHDGLPNAVVEAMIAGTSVVASAVGGIPEIIEDGVTGRLTPAHDIDALVTVLREFIEHPDETLRYRKPAQEKVRAEYSLKTNTIQFEKLLQEELDAYRSAPSTLRAPNSLPQQATIPVLFLMSAMRTGGEETEVSLLAKFLDRQKFPISVLTTWAVNEPSPAIEKLRQAGITVDETCHNLTSLEEKVGYILHVIRQNAIRVVVGCQDTLIAYHVFQHLSPDECQLIEHAGIVEEVDRIPKDRTARMVGVSRAIADQSATLVNGRSLFIPSMVDCNEFSGLDRSTLRQGYGFGTDCVVTFVGRLDRKKGIDDLIDAAEKVLSSHAEVRFLVVGAPDAYQPHEANRLMTKAKNLPHPDRFVFAGGRSDVHQILYASDIFVYPASAEGMSHAINEAGAAGLPVIAADDGAARDQLQNGVAGVLVDVGRPDQIVDAIEALLNDSHYRRLLGERLKKHVLVEYDAKNVVQQWEALLEETGGVTKPRKKLVDIKVINDDDFATFPAEIQIETNTICNATCIMCPYPEVSKELPSGRMDAELYDHILKQCSQEPHLWRIEPFLNNEPFTDSRLVDWIIRTKAIVPYAMVTVTTNGSLLTPRVTDRLIHSGLDAIWFSFNGATKETYEKIMGLSFDEVKANIEYLLKVRPPSLQIFTNMIDTTVMQGEIVENIRYWQSLGVGSGSSPLVNRAGNVKNFDELNRHVTSKTPVRVCELLYHKMYIGYNGDVLLCCMDWRRRVVLGNARKQSLREIWNGDMYQRYRRLHEGGRSEELDLCTDCSYVYS